MKAFSIFPHKGYLNTNFHIQVFDERSWIFYIDQNTHPIDNIQSFRIPEGIHYITGIAKEDETVVDFDKVEVEDAIRLGGSKIERGYCFGNSPWVAVARKDRTYFLNTENGSHFVENGLSPIDIIALNKELLILAYGSKDEYSRPNIMEYSLYNVSQGTIQKRFDKFVFHNSEFVVFSDIPDDNGVCLNVIWYNENAVEMTIHCKSYTIVDNALYCCIIETDKYRIIKVNSSKHNEEIPFCTGPQNEFVGFVLDHYFIRRSGMYYYLKDIISPSNHLGISIWRNGVIREINGLNVTDSNLVEEFYTLVVNNKSICSDLYLKVDISDVIIYECGDGIYGKYINYNYPYWDYNYKRPTVSCSLNQMGDSGNIEIDRWDDIFSAEEFLIVKRNDTIKIIQKGKIIRELSNVRLKTAHGKKYLYIKDENESRSVFILGATSDKLIVQGASNEIHLDYVDKYGIIGENSRNYRIYYIDSDRWDNMPHNNYILEEKCGQCFLRDTDDDGQSYLLTEITTPVALPVNVSKILSISPNGNSILSESQRGIILHEKSSSNLSYEINEKLIDAIDTSEYRNALFSDDGSHTIFQKNGAWYYYDTETEKEVGFEMTTEVLKCQRKGMYGMNFYACFNDTSRRVDLLDPISLQTIAPFFLSNYMFVSPSGKLASRTNKTDARINYFLTNRKKGSNIIEFRENVTEYISEKRLMEIYLHGCHKCEDTADLFSEAKMKLSMQRWNNYNLEQRVHHLEFAFPGSQQEDWEKEMIDILSERLNKKEGNNDCFCLYAEKHAIIDVLYTKTEEIYTTIELPVNLHFLNRIVFSGDDRYVSICGKTDLGGNYKDGFIGVYDLESKKWIYGPHTPNLAIWKSFFTIDDSFAYYNSKPDAMFGNINDGKLNEIEGRSILTYSRSGKYIAMSDKGYIPFSVNTSAWGHMKSSNIYIRRVGKDTELCFSDHGDEILDLLRADVTNVSFSPDDKKLMSVSQDGVIIIRNLHLQELEMNDKEKIETNASGVTINKNI